jgi:hypothetical protein
MALCMASMTGVEWAVMHEPLSWAALVGGFIGRGETVNMKQIKGWPHEAE